MSRMALLVCPAALMVCFATGTSAITIQFDYSLDGPLPLFDSPEKKAVLEAAADVYEQLIGDRLLAIEPSGDNWWRVHIPHPGPYATMVGEPMTAATAVPEPASVLLLTFGLITLAGVAASQRARASVGRRPAVVYRSLAPRSFAEGDVRWKPR